MLVSLLLPCYNPPPGWEDVIGSNYAAFCAATGQQVELIVVMDGGDVQRHAPAISRLQQYIPSVTLVQYAENMGKGYAIRQGVKSAKGSIIIYTDVDFPYTIGSMTAVYEGLKNNAYDVGLGVKNNSYYTQVPFLRRTISHFLRFLIRLFLSMPVTDTQCGLKGFRQEVKPLFLQTTINRYLFDLEFIRNCYKSKKYRVQPIPVTLNENVQFRKMDYRILLPEMLNFVKVLFK